MTELKIGSIVWIFDINHRVYRRYKEGRAIGARYIVSILFLEKSKVRHRAVGF